jgi:hypothetical protein
LQVDPFTTGIIKFQIGSYKHTGDKMMTLPEHRYTCFKVQMLAFGNPGEIRIVDVPENRFIMEDYHDKRVSLDECLQIIFYYGQNDFQPRKHPSVSVGDVIEFDNKKYRVEMIGFSEVKENV